MYDRHLDVSATQRPGGQQAAKARADDHDGMPAGSPAVGVGELFG
jgi:hypothetical protein